MPQSLSGENPKRNSSSKLPPEPQPTSVTVSGATSVMPRAAKSPSKTRWRSCRVCQTSGRKAL